MFNFESLNQNQVNAVLQMGQGVPDYNKGVCAMLGMLSEWHEWDLTLRRQEALSNKVRESEKEAAPNTFESMLAHTNSAEAKEAQQKLHSATGKVNEAWGPIQAIIDECREKNTGLTMADYV